MEGKRVMLKYARSGEVSGTVYHVYLLPKAFKPEKARKEDFVKSGEVNLDSLNIGEWMGEKHAKAIGVPPDSETLEIDFEPYKFLKKEYRKLYEPIGLGYGHEILQEIERVVHEKHPNAKSLHILTVNEAVNKMAKKAGYTHILSFDTEKQGKMILSEGTTRWAKTLENAKK